MLDKHRIQLDTCNKIGAMLDDLLEGCQRELYEAYGAQKAMAIVKSNLVNLITVTKEELLNTPPETAEPAMRTLARMQESLESFMLQCKTWEIAARGKIQATEATVSVVKKESNALTMTADKHTARPRGVKPEGTKLLRIRPETEDTSDAPHT